MKPQISFNKRTSTISDSARLLDCNERVCGFCNQTTPVDQGREFLASSNNKVEFACWNDDCQDWYQLNSKRDSF
jgi:hypothetical protein